MSIVLVNDYLTGRLGESKVLWNHMLENIPNLKGIDMDIMKNNYDNNLTFEQNVETYIKNNYSDCKLIIQNGSYFNLIQYNCKKIILIQDNLRKTTRFKRRNIQENNFANADIVVVNSNEVKEYYKERDCVLISLGVDDTFLKSMIKNHLRLDMNLPTKYNKFGIFVGSMTETKGWNIMLNIINRRQDIFWIIVTKLETDSFNSINSIVYKKIKQELLVKLLNCSDFFILPSPSETQCLAAIEANLCNVPTMMRNTGYFSDLSKEELNNVGIMTNNFSDDDIDQILTKKFNPREIVIEKYSIKQSMNKWNNLINSIMSSVCNYDPYNFIDINSSDIHFSNVFVDKILLKYFPNKNQELIFMEIGALHGNDSCYFKNKYNNSIVYAIEGSKEVYDKYLIGKGNQINIFNECIFNHNGKIKYHVKKNNENGLLSGIHSVYNRGDKYGTNIEEVECHTLDQFCLNNNINHIDILKLDVEGATYDVLNNSHILKTIKIMHIETEDYEFFKGQKLDDDVTVLLVNNNFQLICKSGYFPTKDGKQYDSVWINNLYKNKFIDL